MCIRDRVRAACTGRVVFAGLVAGVGTVSVRCGAWRVSYAPLTRVAVRAGGRIGAGAHLGRARAALHLGVRRRVAASATSTRWASSLPGGLHLPRFSPRRRRSGGGRPRVGLL